MFSVLVFTLSALFSSNLWSQTETKARWWVSDFAERTNFSLSASWMNLKPQQVGVRTRRRARLMPHVYVTSVSPDAVLTASSCLQTAHYAFSASPWAQRSCCSFRGNDQERVLSLSLLGGNQAEICSFFPSGSSPACAAGSYQTNWQTHGSVINGFVCCLARWLSRCDWRLAFSSKTNKNKNKVHQPGVMWELKFGEIIFQSFGGRFTPV